MYDLWLFSKVVVGWGGKEVNLGVCEALVSGEDVVGGEGLLDDVVMVVEHLHEVVLGVSGVSGGVVNVVPGVGGLVGVRGGVGIDSGNDWLVFRSCGEIVFDLVFHVLISVVLVVGFMDV